MFPSPAFAVNCLLDEHLAGKFLSFHNNKSKKKKLTANSQLLFRCIPHAQNYAHKI